MLNVHYVIHHTPRVKSRSSSRHTPDLHVSAESNRKLCSIHVQTCKTGIFLDNIDQAIKEWVFD